MQSLDMCNIYHASKIDCYKCPRKNDKKKIINAVRMLKNDTGTAFVGSEIIYGMAV